MIALTTPSAGGHVTVVGHTTADLAKAGTGSPNRLVHFADDKTASHLEFLTHALKESGRDNTATAVLAVLTPEQLSKAHFTQGVIYAEAQDNSWGHIFGVNGKRPHTLIAGPRGNVLWRHDGELDTAALASALRKYLVKDARVQLGVLRMPLRAGRPAPNFVFEIAPGQLMPLRKLKGRPVVLVFWRSSSKPSIEAVRDLQASSKSNGDPVLFAVNDGEDIDTANKIAKDNGFQCILLTDPERRISVAYGVSLWPSVVFMDAAGMVSGVRYGRGAGSVMDASSAAASSR
jgi:peroxiredoxin